MDDQRTEPTIYLVTVDDYESATIIGAYSTRERAEHAASKVDVVQYGRMGPHVVGLDVDPETPMPVWADGEERDD